MLLEHVTQLLANAATLTRQMALCAMMEMHAHRLMDASPVCVWEATQSFAMPPMDVMMAEFVTLRQEFALDQPRRIIRPAMMETSAQRSTYVSLDNVWDKALQFVSLPINAMMPEPATRRPASVATPANQTTPHAMTSICALRKIPA